LIKRALQEQFDNPSGFDLKRFCFKEQFEFISDASRFKVAVCSRRSGKTIACAAHLLSVATTLHNRVCLYITLSRLNAKRIIWNNLLSLNQRFGLGGEPNETELSIYFPSTQSMIYLSGAKDKSEIEKFRGMAISLCYIDEVQAFRSYIKDLIDDVIGPALIDYAGTLCLIGTPGPVPSGYFYDCAEKSDNWSKHRWTFWQNPFIEQTSQLSHSEILEAELKRRGVNINDPSVQREWFGKWVLDSDSLLIKYDPIKNHYDSVPLKKLVYILGIDIGFIDSDALAVLAWSNESKSIYLIDEVVKPKQDLTDLIEQVKKLQLKYDFSKIVMDEGGLGKKMAEEMRRRYHLPIHPADKQRKMENVALLNDALRTGVFFAKKESRFAEDSYLVEVDIDKSTPDKIKVKSGYHSDVIDSVIYAFKESPAYAYVKPKEKPKYGSDAWAKAETTRMEEAALEYFKKQDEVNKEYNEYYSDENSYTIR